MEEGVLAPTIGTSLWRTVGRDEKVRIRRDQLECTTWTGWPPFLRRRRRWSAPRGAC